ncbi:MAG: beta-lactamase family protein [Planctomycetes bacterium]|nr:beta-lactamase family protein [Planctomycetota bacterium]
MRLLPPALLAALALTLPALAQDDVVVEGDLGRALDAAVEKRTAGEHWGAVLVAKGGKVLLAKGYGSADYAKEPNTPRTLFEIASTSKMFTATAILKLEMQGKLSIEDPITKFFKKVPKDKAGITVKHLLTHTSGMTVDALLPYQSPESADEFVKLAMKEPLQSKVGEKFAYSNPGYALLGVIVEKASGKKFEAYLRENLFEPAGMKDTGFVQDKSLDEKRASVRRDRDSKQKIGTAIAWGWGWGYRGMGGIVTTVWDLYRFDVAMRAGKILSEEAQKKQIVPEQAGYGLGCLIATTDRGTKRMEHSGSVAGYLANIVRYVDDDALIVILGNSDCDLGGVEKALSAVLFPPLTLDLEIDVKDRKLNGSGGLVLTKGATLKATKEKEEVILSVETKDGAPLRAHFPLEAAAGLAKILEDEVAQRKAAGEKDDGSLEVGVYTLRLGLKDGQGRVKGATFTLMPGYNGVDSDGNDIVDNRMTLTLVDPATGQWPMMAHLSLSAADDLASELRRAAGK